MFPPAQLTRSGAIVGRHGFRNMIGQKGVCCVEARCNEHCRHNASQPQMAACERAAIAASATGIRDAHCAACCTPVLRAVGTGHFVAPAQIRVARPRYSPTPQARRFIRMTFSGIYLLPQRRPGRGVGSRMIQMDTCGMEVASSSSRNRHALAPPFAGQLRKRHGPPRGSRSVLA